jgi:hypothetical protein
MSPFGSVGLTTTRTLQTRRSRRICARSRRNSFISVAAFGGDGAPKSNPKRTHPNPCAENDEFGDDRQLVIAQSSCLVGQPESRSLARSRSASVRSRFAKRTAIGHVTFFARAKRRGAVPSLSSC